MDGYDIRYYIGTSSTSGTISTQFFKENFDPDKVELSFMYEVAINPPKNILSYENVTLHFEIEKVSMKNILTNMGKDTVTFDNYMSIDEDLNYIHKNYTQSDKGLKYRKYILTRLIG